MSNHQDGGNVIHIFGGDKANDQDDYRKGSGTATPNPAYGGYGPLLRETSQNLKSRSSNFVMVEDGSHGRPYKVPHCKLFSSGAGCPYGDNCIYIHDEGVANRESLAVVVTPGLCGVYPRGAASGVAAPLPLATPPRPLADETAMRPLLVQTESGGTMRPLYYRTKICSKWQQGGYCNYGSRCHFAHGEAELRRSGGRGPPESEANLNNQQAVVQNLPAAYMPFPASAVTAATPANAGRSRQMAGAVQGPIPSRNAWKVPKKINGIYGDWIDGHDID